MRLNSMTDDTHTLHVDTAAVRILVVEEETRMAMIIEDALLELGCEVVGPISNLDGCMTLASGEPLHGALITMTLGGESIYPVADALRARAIPFAFITNLEQEPDERYAEVPVLSRPCRPDRIAALVRQHMRLPPP